MLCAIADHFGVTTDELLGRRKDLKKLVLVTGGEDRKEIERLLRSHGFCAVGYEEDIAQAGQLCREMGAAGVLRIGQESMTEAQKAAAGKCNMGDCIYDEPEDLWSNLDTILVMMEKHF